MTIVRAMSEPTPLRQLAEDRLGQPVAEFIAERRPHLSWRRIAIEVTAKTGVDISGETLRLWSQSLEPVA